jgi:leucyl/phenylalanyl-tRNA--protein transferase
VPVDPPPSRWRFPPAASWGDDDLIASGGDLEPGTLLSAYRHGLFPMPAIPGTPMAWWSPDPRGVLPLDGLRLSRSARRSVQRFEVRIDSAFAEVVAACADPRRPGGWITEEMRAAYVRLHELGWAHSVEAWDADGLAGGLYGVAIAGLFAGESMFHRRTDASKVALVALVELLRSDREPERLLDVQWATPHLARLGVVEVPRATYLARLSGALDVALPARWA